MEKRKNLRILCIMVLMIFILFSCKKIFSRFSKEEEVKTVTAPSIISSYTSGMISTKKEIIVRFAQEIAPPDEINQPLKKSPFKIEPSVKGYAVWKDKRTLAYIPENRLQPGKKYKVSVKVAQLMEVAEEYAEFQFQFSTKKQAYNVYMDGWEIKDEAAITTPSYKGRLVTDDFSENDEIEKMLTAEFKGSSLEISWTHSGKSHQFIIMGIKREKEAGELIIKWDGEPIGVKKKGDRTIKVPSKDSFFVLDVKAVQKDTDYIEIQFSDPLLKPQDLRGLISVSGVSSLRYVINNNIVEVYSNNKWPNEVNVTIEKGIQNALGSKLKDEKKIKIVLKLMEPEVKFVGKGVIVPTNQNLIIPIETINLNSIVVEAMKLYENNIGQFLQVNNLEGDKELRRVGRVIWKKILPINITPETRNQWIRTGLDLSPLIQDDYKGLYRLTVYFDRRHIEYKCPAVTEEELKRFVITDEEDTESSYWDYYDEYGYNYWEYYENRRNPCHPAFYKKYNDHDIRTSRNFLISDIGLIAKKSVNNNIIVAASNLKTAEPFQDVKVSILDYQLQQVGEGKTGSDGIAEIQADYNPYLIIAEKDGQAGYLKVNDGTVLSVSHFDVGGSTIKNGLKGFIYSERGVYRPGDDIYLGFILVDKNNTLPEDHPVTLQFFNPRGQMIRTITKSDSTMGFYHFKLGTEDEAPTGNWPVRIAVGGVTFEKVLSIETVKPNRLKIAVTLDDDAKSIRGEYVNGLISVKWLHGAIAKNLNADMSLTLTPSVTGFSKYEDFVFDDPVVNYYPEEHSVFSGRLDQNGEARFDANVYSRSAAPGKLNAHFKTRVYEPGGNISADRFSVPFHPYEQYVGIMPPKGDKARGMLLTDKKHKLDIVLVDPDGEPIKDGTVTAEIYKIKWRWWWEKGTDSISEYLGTSSYKSLLADDVTIKDGKGSWEFEIKYPSWGRYLLRVKDKQSGHATGKVVYIDWPGWAGRPQGDSPGGAAVLTLTSDKEVYQAGEKAMITIPSSEDGYALIALETGGNVFKSEWIKTGDKQTVYELPTDSAMTPNLYVHVTYVQPHMQDGNDRPIRMYGVLPVIVEDPATKLVPVLETADIYEPLSDVDITISEQNGEPMAYTIAIVDEGLLGLTRFKTPDPWKYFYRREALGVKTWDLYDMVAAAYGGKLEQLLAIGGGGGEEEPEGRKAKRFPPMVKFLGPFELDKKDSATHTVSIPQYIGAVRVMVVAGNRKAFGHTEKEVLVKKPVMVMGTLPRVVSVTEEMEMPVSVFAIDDAIKKITVTVKTSGPLSILGESVKTLSFDGPDDKMVNFSLKAGSGPGIANVDIIAEGHGNSAAYPIEIDVRMPNLAVTDVFSEAVMSGKSWDREIPFPGIAGTNNALLEVSRIPPLNLGKRLGFLIRYPHGCVEQTTSSVFPQVYLNKLVTLLDDQADKVQSNIEAGIERLKLFQTSSGGFGYWPGDHEAHTWASNYAGHFLVEAENAGYVIPFNMKEDWIRYQRQKAYSWSGGSGNTGLIQAYRLYTLALAGEPELGAMNRLREVKDLPDAAKYRLAAAYALSGQEDEAKRLTKGDIPVIGRYIELGNTYGSDLRDKAMILEGLVLMEQFDRIKGLVEEISAELAGDKWLSTQTTAYCLIAMAKYAGYSGDDGSEQMRYTYAWSGGTKAQQSSDAPISQVTLDVGDTVSGSISFTNDSAYIVYPRVIVDGKPALGEEQAASNGISLSINYQTAGGSSLDVTRLEQGRDFVAKITVSNTGNMSYEEIALSQIVPSGWEIHNARLDGGSSSGQFEYQDIRDDRVYTYFDLKYRETKTFKIMLNASYLGKFYLPLSRVEAMYDETINARTKGQWIEVVKTVN